MDLTIKKTASPSPNKKIGIFDSGVGGLGLYQALVQSNYPVEVHYYADQKYLPYGNKPLELIQERASIITEFLFNKGCDHILVACNTATAHTIDYLRNKFKEITFVGIEPFIKYIYQLEADKKNQVGLLLTQNTFDSPRFKQLLATHDPDNHLKIYPCPGLADWIEKNFISVVNKDIPSHEKLCLKQILSKVPFHHHQKIILGCTHYPLIKEILSEDYNIKCISPEVPVIQRLLSFLPPQKENNAALTHVINEKLFYFYSSLETADINFYEDIAKKIREKEFQNKKK